MSYMKEQIKVIKERDPAIKSTAEVLLYPSFYALLFHRWAHWFYKKKRFFIGRAISQISRGLTGIEIHPGATIGKGLFIDHGMGVVIGETCEIGDNVTIYHGVTLGGTGKDHGKRHPTIGNNVMISTGAKVLGPFKVGDNSRIAANAVVLQEIPEGSTVVGIPGKVVRIQGQKVNPCKDLDQVKIPDPVKMEICRLKEAVGTLEKQLIKMDSKVGEMLMVDTGFCENEPMTYVEELIKIEDNEEAWIPLSKGASCEGGGCMTREACKVYDIHHRLENELPTDKREGERKND